MHHFKPHAVTVSNQLFFTVLNQFIVSVFNYAQDNEVQTWSRQHSSPGPPLNTIDHAGSHNLCTALSLPQGRTRSEEPRSDMTNLLELIRDQVRAEVMAQRDGQLAAAPPTGSLTTPGTSLDY